MQLLYHHPQPLLLPELFKVLSQGRQGSGHLAQKLSAGLDSDACAKQFWLFCQADSMQRWSNMADFAGQQPETELQHVSPPRGPRKHLPEHGDMPQLAVGHLPLPHPEPKGYELQL